MKQILILCLGMMMFSCGTKYHYEDTGITSGRFHGNMYEYLKSEHEFDSMVKVIERAGLVPMFEKENITFLAPMNFVLEKWFYYDDKNGGYDQAVSYIPHGYKAVDDIDPEVCKRIVLSHIVEGKIMRDDVPRATFNELGERNGGGTIIDTRNGNKIWLWSVKEPYMNIPDMGPVIVSLASLKNDQTVNKNIGIVFPDHEPDNGAVIILPYSYQMGELCDVMFEYQVSEK